MKIDNKTELEGVSGLTSLPLACRSEGLEGARDMGTNEEHEELGHGFGIPAAG